MTVRSTAGATMMKDNWEMEPLMLDNCPNFALLCRYVGLLVYRRMKIL